MREQASRKASVALVAIFSIGTEMNFGEDTDCGNEGKLHNIVFAQLRLVEGCQTHLLQFCVLQH